MKNIRYFISESDVNKAKEIITKFSKNEGPFIGIIPSGGWESKRMDPDKWVDICKTILENIRCKLLLLWGPGDEKDRDFIKSKIQQVMGPDSAKGFMNQPGCRFRKK